MAISVPSMEELLEAGVHFGHQVRRGNPKMRSFIYGARDGVHIIDLAKSEDYLKRATQAAFDLGKEGKVMLVVGTKKQAREVVESLAKEAGLPYLTSHWVGGLLTNFDEITKNIKKLTDLKTEKQQGTLSRYTKREQLLIDRKLSKFDQQLGGVASLNKIPDAIFLVDTVTESTAMKEAHRTSVLLLGFADTNSDPSWLDFPIPANDDGIKSIKIVCETIIKAYEAGKKAAGVASAKETEEKSKVDKAEEEKLDDGVAEQAAVIEEEVEKEVLEESERKVE